MEKNWQRPRAASVDGKFLREKGSIYGSELYDKIKCTNKLNSLSAAESQKSNNHQYSEEARTAQETIYLKHNELDLCQCRCCFLCQERYDRQTALDSPLDSAEPTSVKYYHRTPEEPSFGSNMVSNDKYSLCDQSNSEKSKTVIVMPCRTRVKLVAQIKTTKNVLIALLLNIFLSHLNQINLYHSKQSLQSSSFTSQILVLAEEINLDNCSLDDDCRTGQICHENKCICPRNSPIDDKERSACLQMALIDEPCYTDNQCLSSAKCIDGVCNCGTDFIKQFNPSTKLNYCHQKRRLNEECNHDAQCPENAFCSIKKRGCLCQNGYGAGLVTNNISETLECLPKVCTKSSDCESEFHTCDDNKCKCLALHFDPHKASCSEFALTGDDQTDGNGTSGDGQIGNSQDKNGNLIDLILKDLTNDGDRIWPIVVLLIVTAMILLLLITCIVRKILLGYCWTARKKEYEPNNDNPNKKGQHFSKNSINNKSFRQRKGETDDNDGDQRNMDDGENTAADRSNLMTTNGSISGATKEAKKRTRSPSKSNGNSSVGANKDYVKVDISNSHTNNEAQDTNPPSDGHYYQPFHQVISQPLASSTSTPV